MVPNVAISGYGFVPLLPGARTATCSTRGGYSVSRGMAPEPFWCQHFSGISGELSTKPSRPILVFECVSTF
jgi:hypothetical protein